MSKKVLLLDCDGVLADCSTVVHSFAQRLLARPLPSPETWVSWHHEEAMGMTPEESDFFHRSALGSTFPHEIKLYPGAARDIEILKQHFEVHFATAPWRFCTSWVVAREKLLEQFGCPVHFTKHKHMLKGFALVDDSAENVAKGGHELDLLYSRPYNADSDLSRINHLFELLKYA